eukprot:TRINITY_DN11545_c0_g1_i1.p1 TRINITY_DN11545_c0_g1~~TRINITY_DN11545_c0_g1_i1.p1  ORF type:complete len:290 (-),score=63.45 TRINITY_DN11545_c0_g1_i1:36-785(-)
MRMIHDAVDITDLEHDEIIHSVGDLVTLTGLTKVAKPILCNYATDQNGDPKKAAVYRFEDHCWYQVYEDTNIFATGDEDSSHSPKNQYQMAMYRKTWKSKDILESDLDITRDFTIKTPTGLEFCPKEILKRDDDYPLLSLAFEKWTPPDILSAEGTLLAEVYKTGSYSFEKILSEDTTVTALGTLQFHDGKKIIVPQENKPFIVTTDTYDDIKDSVLLQGAPYLLGSVFSGIASIGVFAAYAAKRRRNH